MPHDTPSAPAGASAFAIHPPPTPFADLNALLARLIEGARQSLGDAFIGAYLQGSFALGDFDTSSDVDFLIVTDGEIAPDALTSLRNFHAELHAMPSPWAQRLEGSYAPATILRRKDGQPRDPPDEPRPEDWADPGTSGGPPTVYPFHFKGNGEASLVRSEHDNTEVVRWIAREAGIVLCGPPPAHLIDPVPTEALKAEIRETLARVLKLVLDDGLALDQLWLQAFFVTLACRTLHTLDSGRVTSKKAASAWGARALGARWAPLIGAALSARERPLAERLAPPTPEAVEGTMAFLRMVRSRSIIERQLALKRQAHGGPAVGQGGARANGPIGGKPSRGPSPIRPGGRGRRG